MAAASFIKVRSAGNAQSFAVGFAQIFQLESKNKFFPDIRVKIKHMLPGIHGIIQSQADIQALLEFVQTPSTHQVYCAVKLKVNVHGIGNPGHACPGSQRLPHCHLFHTQRKLLRGNILFHLYPLRGNAIKIYFQVFS
jgi:hypothetical protein